jgi:LPS export ABC transporter protein LptC
MQLRPVRLNNLYLPVMFIGLFTISACENSLSDIKKVSSVEDEKPISRSKGVEIIYSDSTIVKTKITAPLMIDYQDAVKPYKEMPEGVKIVLFDKGLVEKGTVTSDYAVEREKENLVEFRKNVVATNARGETFKSEELIYDLTKKQFSSTKPVQITMANGNVMYGTGFNSNESFYPWHIDQSTGIFHVTSKDNPLNQ